jgi:RNA polymerase sigma-70 factor (ECF subfamily)
VTSVRPDQTRPSLTEEESLALDAAQAGDTAALQALLRRHVGPLLALARRVLHGDHHRAEDLTQETLLAACRGLDAFRGDASVRTWLFRILVRLGSDPARWSKGKLPAAGLEPRDVPDVFSPDPPHASLARELRGRLDEALERLPQRQRTALHLRAVEGMGYGAIAAVMGGTSGAARMLVLTARRNVRLRLGDYLEDTP